MPLSHCHYQFVEHRLSIKWGYVFDSHSSFTVWTSSGEGLLWERPWKGESTIKKKQRGNAALVRFCLLLVKEPHKGQISRQIVTWDRNFHNHCSDWNKENSRERQVSLMDRRRLRLISHGTSKGKARAFPHFFPHHFTKFGFFFVSTIQPKSWP